jgi:hypothetical protein
MIVIQLVLLGDLAFERVVFLMRWSMLLFEGLPGLLMLAFRRKALGDLV